MNLSTLSFLSVLMFLTLSCDETRKGSLPILGNKETLKDGTVKYHSIPSFSFIDQDSMPFTEKSVENHIYVVDFFFISCPSICPMVSRQMLRVYDRFIKENQLKFVSFSIDPKRDTVERLANYARNLGVNTQKWKFVTGEKAAIFDIAKAYFSIAIENAEAPGGFDHSGRLILVDTKKHIRSFCDGTDPSSVDVFMEDIQRLLEEMKKDEKK
ncbi:MAG: SCO family protein [Bacteroidetes bacterium]|nr:SCO family protein [Bacteroidota bacterium]